MTSCSSDPSRAPVRSHLLRKAKRKSLRMSFVIVLASIVCWTPYYIIFIFTTFLNTVIDPQIFNCFAIFGLSNSLLNPIIYGAFQLCKVQYYNSRFVIRSLALSLSKASRDMPGIHTSIENFAV
ncbi:corazonin receptor [Biomphalaria glabrata]